MKLAHRNLEFSRRLVAEQGPNSVKCTLPRSLRLGEWPPVSVSLSLLSKIDLLVVDMKAFPS
jgi:hypothetical protein